MQDSIRSLTRFDGIGSARAIDAERVVGLSISIEQMEGWKGESDGRGENLVKY